MDTNGVVTKVDTDTGKTDISSVLAYMKTLEDTKSELELRLKDTEHMREKTKESVQSMADALAKKWMHTVIDSVQASSASSRASDSPVTRKS